MAAWYVEAPKRTGRTLADFVWPAHCVGCNCPGTWWCLGCDLSVVKLKRRIWNTSSASLDSVSAGASFAGPMRDLIKALKYRHARAIAPSLSLYLQSAANSIVDFDRYVLVPIPLHPSKERQRGHNQSLILADELGKERGVTVVNGLVRTKPTVTQTGLDKAARRENVKDVFRWKRRVKVRPQVILVDDVFTTGATMESAAGACKAAGVKTIRGLAVAKR